MPIEQVLKVSQIKEIHKILGESGSNALLIAGGTDICVKLREGHIKAECLVDISDVLELKTIRERAVEGGDGEGLALSEGLTFGAGVTFSEIVENEWIHKSYLGLWEACHSVGAPQIRNRGTVGGNLANGSPAADAAPPLLALNAKLKLSSAKGQRWVDLSDFYLDKGKTVIQPDELLESIHIPKTNGSYIHRFEKLGLRNALAISRLSLSVWMQLDDQNTIREIRLASGSLGLSPMREPLIEAFLIGKPLNEQTISLGEEAFGNVVQERLAGRSTCPFKKEAIKGIFRALMTGGPHEA